MVQTSAFLWDFKDTQATCLDANKDQIVLAGKRSVAIVSVNNPLHILAKESRTSKWDVSSVHFAPSGSGQDISTLCLTSGQYFEIYSLTRESKIVQSHSVKAHARSLTDLDWCQNQKNLLASCSVDDSIHIWDLRDLRRPVLSIPVVAGANQVKWCRLLDCILATAHDGDIKIWDTRKIGTKTPTPLQNIAAHLSKILGMDWSPTEDVCLVTSGQDSTIKTWNFAEPYKPESQSSSPTPAWKVKYTPKGDSLVTIPLPQVGRPDPTITLWRTEGNSLTRTQSLEGHSDVVLDICWSNLAADHVGLMKLFSLSKGHTMRQWNIGPDALEKGQRLDSLGIGNFETLLDGLEETNVSDRLGTFNVEANLTEIPGLAEFDAIPELNLPDLAVEEVDKDNETLIVSFVRKELIVKLEIRFPIDADKRTQLSFQFLKDTTLSKLGKVDLLNQLKGAFEEPGWNGNEALLPAALKKLHAIIEGLSDVENERLQSLESIGSGYFQSNMRISSPNISNSLHTLDWRVPFPSTTGAKFNSAGILVYFGRVDIAQVGSGEMTSTPRSMSALSKNSDPRFPHSPRHPEFSVEGFYRNKLKCSSSKLIADRKLPESYSDVLVYNVDSLLPISRELAKKYTLSGDPESICAANGAAAAAVGRQDLVQMWALLGQTLSPTLKAKLNPDLETPWAQHPFGRNLVNFYLEYCGFIGDIQSAALIACVFGKKSRFQNPERCNYLRTTSNASSASNQGSTSPYNTVHATFTSESSSFGQPNNFMTLVNRQRSSSFDEPDIMDVGRPCLMDLITISTSEKSASSEQNQHDRNVKLLNGDLGSRLEGVKQAYADALYRWGMLRESAEVLKYSTIPSASHSGPAYMTVCQNCSSECRSAQCHECKSLAFHCSICQMAVRGLSSVCPLCGHGGHSEHMSKWFEDFTFCPAGCGCTCSAQC